MMRPLTGGWLWQTDIEGSRLDSPRRPPIKHRQDALQYATIEAKEAIDREGRAIAYFRNRPRTVIHEFGK
jgi:hypothetical protein